ncbi:MAG: GNAT family N-acetyltransferase [Clostridia bacterium]|nr:GNAT family N-acetyltransferase [Clostridia bacterium]
MRAYISEAAKLSELVSIIWPEHSPEELTRIIEGYMSSEDTAVFEESVDGESAGVALCSLRHDYVEGCDSSPVGYLEGVAVKDGFRKRGIAGRLLAECELWAREKGCTEFASDCELTNTASLAFHLSTGFEEANRIICFKKKL